MTDADTELRHVQALLDEARALRRHCHQRHLDAEAAEGAAVQRVLDTLRLLHRPEQVGEHTMCAHCTSGGDPYTVVDTDYPCATLRVAEAGADRTPVPVHIHGGREPRYWTAMSPFVRYLKEADPVERARIAAWERVLA